MGGEDLEGPEGRLASWFGGCAGVANQHNLDLMDVLRSKSDSRSFIEVYNFFVFLKNCTARTLNIIIGFLCPPELICQDPKPVIKLVVVADKELISEVMDLMSIDGRLLLDSVEKWYDLSKLDDVQQREGELLQLTRNPTCCSQKKRLTVKKALIKEWAACLK